MRTACTRCDGKGLLECPKCEGRGRIAPLLDRTEASATPSFVDEDLDQASVCVNCDRRGVIPCPTCQGTGQSGDERVGLYARSAHPGA